MAPTLHENTNGWRELVAPLGLPPIPPTGWKAVTETNFKEVSEEMPRMMSGNTSIHFLYFHGQVALGVFNMQVPCTPTWQRVLAITS